jgi:hypothetical protein
MGVHETSFEHVKPPAPAAAHSTTDAGGAATDGNDSIFDAASCNKAPKARDLAFWWVQSASAPGASDWVQQFRPEQMTERVVLS